MLANQATLEHDERERAYAVFSNLCRYHVSPSGDSIPDTSVYNYLDAQMIVRLQNEFGSVPEYMIEQSRHMFNATALEIASTEFKNFMYTESPSGLTPFSMLSTFLYDYEMIDDLHREHAAYLKLPEETRPTKSYLEVNDAMIVNLFGYTHQEMKRKTLAYINNKHKEKVFRKNQFFTLEEIIDIRNDFFRECEINPRSCLKRHILTFYTQKGGTGKSHVTVSLAGALALASNRDVNILVIDTDYQRSASDVLLKTSKDKNSSKTGKNIFDLIKELSELEVDIPSIEKFKQTCFDSVVETSFPNIDLVPAGELSEIDANYTISGTSGSKSLRPNSMLTIINHICEFKHYDYVLIDTRPDGGTTSSLSYYACDQQIAVYKATGTDMNAYVNFCRRMAAEVIPKLILRNDFNYKSPEDSLVVINQYQPKLTENNYIVSVLDTVLEASSVFKRAQAIISNSTATTKCSAQESTIWNPVKGTVANKQLSNQRRQFMQLAFEIINQQYMK